MSAIVGVVGALSGAPDSLCALMLNAVAELGPDGRAMRQTEGACVGKLFHNTLPEDDFDRQPYIGSAGSLLLAADGRIDNRSELGRDLGIAKGRLVSLSDTELLLAGWENFGLAVTDRILGDLAFAVWESDKRRLTLARTPLSSRPLFFHANPSFTAFGSLPAAILALPGMQRSPDRRQFAKLLGGGLFLPGQSSFFEHIQAVLQGEAVVLRRGRMERHRLWSLAGTRLEISVEAAGDALRTELDRAVDAQLRRGGGGIACLLSAGRDSSAVATAAAKLANDVIALTAAPRDGFPSDPNSRELADESELAGRTAALTGLEHMICRAERTALGPLLDRVHKLHFQPFGNPVNLPWIAKTAQVAAIRAPILLTGAAGNFTISLGGPAFLADCWRERGLWQWWNLARQGGAKPGWLRVLSNSFAALVPAPFYSFLHRIAGRRPADWHRLPLLRSPFRQLAEEFRRKRFEDARSAASRRDQYAKLVQAIEPGDSYSLAQWGVDIRDPTADRRLVELCYSLPVEAFYGAGSERPAYEAAFAARIPGEVLNNPKPGYQAADWYDTIDPDELRSTMERYARHPFVAELFDMEAVYQRISEWPQIDTASAYEDYCNQLLVVISVASFINVQFAG